MISFLSDGVPIKQVFCIFENNTVAMQRVFDCKVYSYTPQTFSACDL